VKHAFPVGPSKRATSRLAVFDPAFAGRTGLKPNRHALSVDDGDNGLFGTAAVTIVQHERG
jgi:hypothetical protein